MLRFLTISLLFHAIAIGAWHYTKPWQAANSQDNVVAITLINNIANQETPVPEQLSGVTQGKPRNVRKRTTPVAGIAKPETGIPLHGITTRSNAAQKPAEPEYAIENFFDPEDDNGDSTDKVSTQTTLPDTAAYNSSSIKAVKAAVALAFQANFRYPRIARRNDWEGTVTLKLRVLPSGQLENILLSKSSGFSTLDNAAMKSMQMASVPEAKTRLNGKPMDIIVPVIYRLTDS